MSEARKLGRDAYDYIDSLLEQTPPGAGGMLFLPYLLGERNLGIPFSKGTMLGITNTTDAAHMARSILEGVAFSLRRGLDALKDHRPVEYVIHSGGSANGDTWNQIKADIYDLPVKTVTNHETTALGAAIVAGVGVGLWDSVEQAVNNTVLTGKVYEPNPQNRALYADLYGLFKAAHDRLDQTYIEMARVYGII